MTERPHVWDPRDYAAHSSAQTGWARELMVKLGLSGREHVLDIGCGDGKVSAQLAALVPAGGVLGIDVSSDMITAAVQDFPRSTHPNLEFRQMDAACIDLPPDYDVAFSNAALHWVEDQRAVLAGVAACLRPEGRLLFQMGGRGNAREVLEAAATVMSQAPWEQRYADFVPPYHFYGPEEYRVWLEQAGFHVLRAESVPKDMCHDSVSGLMGWLRTTWFPFTDVLPPQWREDFLERVAAAYLIRHPPDAAGRTHVAMVRLEVEARLEGGS